MKKFKSYIIFALFVAVLLTGINSGFARSITGTGMFQGDLVYFLGLVKDKVNRLSDNRCFGLASLADNTSNGYTAKIGNATSLFCSANGTLIKLDNSTVLGVPTSGNTTDNNSYNVVIWYAYDNGTTYGLAGTAASTLATVTLPAIPSTAAAIGGAYIHPTAGYAYVTGDSCTDNSTQTCKLDNSTATGRVYFDIVGGIHQGTALSLTSF